VSAFPHGGARLRGLGTCPNTLWTGRRAGTGNADQRRGAYHSRTFGSWRDLGAGCGWQACSKLGEADPASLPLGSVGGMGPLRSRWGPRHDLASTAVRVARVDNYLQPARNGPPFPTRAQNFRTLSRTKGDPLWSPSNLWRKRMTGRQGGPMHGQFKQIGFLATSIGR
jgi:hypothetical protein